MKRLALLITIIGVCVVCFLNTTSSRALPNYGPLSKFSLVDLNNTEFSSRELHGEVWLIHTFFSNCPAICPTMIGDLKTLLRDLPALEQQPRILSVSVDPARDDTSTLRKYFKKHNLHSIPHWHMVTGQQDEVAKFANVALKLGFPANPDEHSPRVVLLDRDGDVRGFYSIADKKQALKLSNDVQSLLS